MFNYKLTNRRMIARWLNSGSCTLSSTSDVSSTILLLSSHRPLPIPEVLYLTDVHDLSAMQCEPHSTSLFACFVSMTDILFVPFNGLLRDHAFSWLCYCYQEKTNAHS